MPKTHVSNNKMDKICRLCAKRSSSLTSLFSFKNQRLIIDLIITICPIRIDRNDEFPKKICDECLEIIVSANELRSTSVKSDNDFRLGSISLINNEDIEEISVTDLVYVDFVHVKIEKTDDWFACSLQVYSADQSDDEYEHNFESKYSNYEMDVKKQETECRRTIFECDKCVKKCKFRKQFFILFKTHKSITKTNQFSVSSCHIYGQPFKSLGNLKTHLRTHKVFNKLFKLSISKVSK